VSLEQRVQLIEVAAQAIADRLGSNVRGIDRLNAAAVIDALGITQDQWHSDAAVRWDGITDYPTFRITALECPE